MKPLIILWVILFFLILGTFILWDSYNSPINFVENNKNSDSESILNSSSCSTLINISEMDSCYFSLGVVEKNYSICRMIDSPLMASDCVRLIDLG